MLDVEQQKKKKAHSSFGSQINISFSVINRDTFAVLKS